MTNNDTTPNDVVESGEYGMGDNPVEKDPPRGPCYEYQNDHINAEEFFNRIDATPNDDLRELVEEWRGIANQEPMDTDHDRALRYCANELEELIEE